MQHAYAVAKKRGYTVNPQEIDNKVATGPRKPSSGKTNRYILGTDKKQNLHVQVANLDNKRYELNMYIEEVVPEEKIKMDTNEKQLNEGMNTMHDGAFTNEDPIRDAYNKMVAKYNEVDPHTGKEINTEEQLNEKEDGLEEHCGECGAMDHVDEASPEVKKRVGMFNRIRAMRSKSDGKRWVKTDLANEANEETEVNEISDRLAKRAINKAHAASRSADSRGDKKLSRKRANQRDNMTDMLADKQDRREYENPGKGSKRRETVAQMGRHYEELSKNVSKLNKIQENRRLERIKVVADGQGGAGEDGTDKLAKKYQQVTPGQPNNLIKESSVVVNSQDMFKRFEDMVSYMMGISVTHPESFQMFPIGESGKMRLEYEHGPLATICEEDVIQFFGPNTDMEQFVEMVKEFGVNVTTAENSFVIGDSAGTEGTVKEISPGQYAEEYAKKYTTGGMMDQMRANIEELAKRI